MAQRVPPPEQAPMDGVPIRHRQPDVRAIDRRSACHVGDLDVVLRFERAFALGRLGGAGHMISVPIGTPPNRRSRIRPARRDRRGGGLPALGRGQGHQDSQSAAPGASTGARSIATLPPENEREKRRLPACDPGTDRAPPWASRRRGSIPRGPASGSRWRSRHSDGVAGHDSGPAEGTRDGLA
jgi:hypothetical protein